MVRAQAAEEMSPVTTLIEQANRRSLGYWRLSRLFLEVPTPARLGDLRRMLDKEGNKDASAEIAELCFQLEAALAHPNEAAVAFTRHLVVGDKHSGEPLPYEAHVLEGQLPGECTRQVETMMHEAGYGAVASEAPSPDHLGAELRFMALLCHDENQAWLADSNIEAAEYLRLQHQFLADHLVRWAPEYCNALAERTSNGYLRAVAKLTASSVTADLAVLEEICGWILPTEFASPLPTTPSEERPQ